MSSFSWPSIILSLPSYPPSPPFHPSPTLSLLSSLFEYISSIHAAQDRILHATVPLQQYITTLHHNKALPHHNTHHHTTTHHETTTRHYKIMKSVSFRIGSKYRQLYLSPSTWIFFKYKSKYSKFSYVLKSKSKSMLLYWNTSTLCDKKKFVTDS